jgi:adenine-specific DNA-methyltransferase
VNADDPKDAPDSDIEAIRERYRAILEPLRATMNGALEESWEESDIPRDPGDSWPSAAVVAHGQWWIHHTARQRELDAAIDPDA